MRTLSTCVLLASSLAFANASGAIGYSGAPPGGAICNTCHSGGGQPTVTITGPTTLAAGATGNYTLTITGGAGNRAGVNIAVTDTFATLNPISATLGEAFKELHQKAAVNFAGGSAAFQFSLTAPPFAGTVTIYGAGNSCNGDNGTGGDSARAATLAVTISAGSGTNPPLITTPAASVPASPITTRTAQLSVAANDDGSEANLGYTWSSTGPAAVAFAPNGNNAAKAATATFSTAGAYVLTVTVRDGTNRTVTSVINATVQAQYTILRMTPVVVQVAPSATQVFNVTARDQFDVPLTSQPTVVYAVPAGGGTIVDAGVGFGVLRAQSSPGSGFVITAAAMSVVTGSNFSVGMAPPAPNDTVKPTVSLTSPSTPGTRLDPGLLLEATAFDNTGVAEVRFEVAATVVATVTSPPYRTNYVLKTGLDAGLQPLEAVAKDIAGNETRSTAIPVDVPVQATGGGAGGGGGADGGSTGGGAGTGGGGGTTPGGCSCGAAPLGFALIGLLALTRARRRP